MTQRICPTRWGQGHRKNVSRNETYVDKSSASLVFGKLSTNPGPGTYAAIGVLRPDGNYAASKHGRTKTPLIKQEERDEKKTRYARVPFLGKYAPGPGWYDLSGNTMSYSSFKKNVRDSVASSHSFGSIKRKVFVSDSSK